MDVAEVLARLTREEWNAAYLLGAGGATRPPVTLTERLLDGMEQLAAAGHRFTTCREERFPTSPPPNEHERARRELAEGRFDPLGRVAEARRWLAATFPEATMERLRALAGKRGRNPGGADPTRPAP